MRIEKLSEPNQRTQGRPSAPETDTPGPRKLTFQENVILTIKVLVGFAVLGGAIWGINVWKSAR